MATRSVIAIKTSEGYEAIYNHSDGYPEYTGKILESYYNSEDKVKELISHGSMSLIGKNIGEKHDFNDRPKDSCTFYHRDRGEELDIIKTNTKASLFFRADNCGAEWVYIFENSAWTVVSMY